MLGDALGVGGLEVEKGSSLSNFNFELLLGGEVDGVVLDGVGQVHRVDFLLLVLLLSAFLQGHLFSIGRVSVFETFFLFYHYLKFRFILILPPPIHR